MTGDDVKVTFATGGGLFTAAHEVRAVRRGERAPAARARPSASSASSGSGKSTLGRAMLRLLPSEGRIAYLGKPLDPDPAVMRPMRRELQLVFQDPFGSLSPRMTIGRIITEGLLIHEPDLSARERDRRAGEALTEVGLKPDMRNRYPHEFSGGQRQRIAIARAMILKPKVIVLDEPTERARPLGAEADRRSPARPAGGARPLLSLHQPRPRGGAGGVGLHHRDEERADRRGGPDRRRSSTIRARSTPAP